LRSATAHAWLRCTPSERQLWTNTLGLPGNRRGNFTATIGAACQVEAFGIRIRVNGHAGGPAPKSGLKGVSHQCSPDAAIHELWQDPKMVELPRVIRRHQGVEAYYLVPDPCHERRPRSNRVARDAEVLPPRFDRGGRIAPIRFRLERKGGKSFCFVPLRWADAQTSRDRKTTSHRSILNRRPSFPPYCTVFAPAYAKGRAAWG